MNDVFLLLVSYFYYEIETKMFFISIFNPDATSSYIIHMLLLTFLHGVEDDE